MDADDKDYPHECQTIQRLSELFRQTFTTEEQVFLLHRVKEFFVDFPNIDHRLYGDYL